MADPTTVIRDWYVNRLREHYAARYRAYLSGGEGPDSSAELGDGATRPELASLPPAAQEAYQFYRRHFEETDLGSARQYLVPTSAGTTYAVRVRTDGDDGFLEVFDAAGRPLLAGRTYIEVVAWGDRDWLRAQAANPGDLPPALQNADTLWGKPLEG